MQFTNHIRLKVCGMRDRHNISQVAQLHPDYMGFIFYPGSKRVVDNLFEMPADFPGGIKKVGVFVNEMTATISRLSDQYRFDLIQLHGDETVQQCQALRNIGMKIIKAISIGKDFDFDDILPFKKVADYFLFDTKGTERGGTGIAFDWSILERYDQEIPFFLSGGISPGNIQDLVRLKGMNIHAVDVNSGVEITPGIKDIQLVEKVQRSLLNNRWLEY